MAKGEFLTELKSKRVERNGKICHKLIEPLIYTTSEYDKIRVPANFISDGASIPRFAWSIVGHPLGKYLESAIIHDFLYSTEAFSRKKSDWILLDAMKTQKIAWWKRRTMYRMVRIFGGLHKLLTGGKHAKND